MAIARAQLVKEMTTEILSLFGKAYTEEKTNKKKKLEEQTGMLFKYLVTINMGGTIDVEGIPSDTAISSIDCIRYASEEALPKEIGDKMKMLMWTPEETNGGIDEVGVRVGERMFWIV